MWTIEPTGQIQRMRNGVNPVHTVFNTHAHASKRFTLIGNIIDTQTGARAEQFDVISLVYDSGPGGNMADSVLSLFPEYTNITLFGIARFLPHGVIESQVINYMTKLPKMIYYKINDDRRNIEIIGG